MKIKIITILLLTFIIISCGSNKKPISIDIRVNNDRANSLKDAFSTVLLELGFDVRENEPKYILEVDVTLSGDIIQDNWFSRIEISANLLEPSTRSLVILPWNLNTREGHLTADAADARAFRAAASKINEEFKEHISSHMPQIIGKRR